MPINTNELIVIGDVLNDFIAGEGVIAAALIGTDGLIIDSASNSNIDMDRFGALLGAYFANTAHRTQKIRLLPLPKQEEASYVLLADVSGALFALFTNNTAPYNEFNESDVYNNFKKDIHHVKLALSKESIL
ncbi:MAG: hypothetical protein OEM38_04870 [Gammaproteobacteria bacterium]|nr:hypothetical protein [Gammaproteobacteria bacterium]